MNKYITVMAPYPSGSSLHCGHYYNYAIVDSYCKIQKYQGHEVFQPFSYDSFGLPTENYAIKIGRDVTEVSLENIESFRHQMEKMNTSFEEKFTTSSSDFIKKSQWLFSKLLEHGLAYKAEQEQCYCPSCKTALIQYPTSEGIKRAKNLLNTKSITYQNLKRLKNFFDYYNPQTTSAEQYQLAGGDKMKSWVETVLDSERQGVKQNTETTSDMHVNNRGSKLSNPNPLQKEELDQMGNIMTEGVNLKEDKAIILSDRDLGIFVNAIMNPRNPSENLVKAAENYKKILRENHNEIVNDGLSDGVNEGINDGVNEG